MKKFFWFLNLLTLLTLSLSLIFKVFLNSDSLILDNLFVDLDKYRGNWFDWKMSAAPAYFPDVIAYGIFYKLTSSVAARILAVSVVQVVLLTVVILWLAKTIRPGISNAANTFIVLMVSVLVTVAIHSKMWLFFYSTNNHFSSLLFSLLGLGLLFRFNFNNSIKKVCFIFMSVVLLAQTSSSLFMLTFSVPLALMLLAQSFLLGRAKDERGNSIKLLFFLAVSHSFALLVNNLITAHNPLAGRVGIGIDVILNSLRSFVNATKVTFGHDNPYTFAFTLMIIFTFVHLLYTYFYKRRFDFLLKLKAHNFDFLDVAQRQDFAFMFLMVVIPITFLGSIFSGGFVDDYGYRYFSFPLALSLILWTLVLDNEAFFDRYFYVLIGMYVVLLGIAFGSAGGLFKESGRTEYNQLYRSGIYTDREEKLARCLNNLSDDGVRLRGGVADFWNARGVSYKTKSQPFILPILNDAEPFFWMSSLGPLKYSQRYDFDYYNFAILYKANYPNQFNFNTSTVGALLPKPSETFDCGDREIWVYKDKSLDQYIREKINNFLLIETGMNGFNYSAKNLPGQVGEVVGNERVAVQGRDKPGLLTYGPYIKLKRGKYRVHIRYQSDSEKNTWDIGRFNDTRKYFNRNVVVASGSLPNTQNRENEQTFLINVKHSISQFELRIFYAGEGSFVLKGIQMSREEKD